MSSSTSRSFVVHVFTRNRPSLLQKNQEEDFPDADAVLMTRSDVALGTGEGTRVGDPSAPKSETRRSSPSGPWLSCRDPSENRAPPPSSEPYPSVTLDPTLNARRWRREPARA